MCTLTVFNSKTGNKKKLVKFLKFLFQCFTSDTTKFQNLKMVIKDRNKVYVFEKFKEVDDTLSSR